MKQVYPNYTFNAATKTITLVGVELHQGQILLITNATRGAIYYNFASSSLRAAITTGSGNTTIVLTDASTAGHQNTDKLIIHYDDFQEKIGVAGVDLVSGLRDGDGNTFGIDRDFPVSGTVDISGVKNASEFESGISLIRAANFPANFTNFNGFYRLNYIDRANNSDGVYANYLHCNAADFQEFTPRLVLERISGQWAWFFRAEENVCIKYIPAPSNGTYVSPILNNFEPGAFGGSFTSVYVVRADAIPTINPAIGNTHDLPALDATVDFGVNGSSLIALGKGIFQKLKLVPSIGANTDTSAASDTGNFSLFSFFKRLLSVKLPNAVSGRVPVDGSGVTQPVSAASLPLPSGAATSANQTTANASLSSIDSKLPSLSGGRLPVDIGGNGSITVTSGTITVSNDVEVKNDSGNPVPASVSSLPLPTGAATSANQTTTNTSLGSQADSAASTDTGTASLIGLAKRLLQRISTLMTLDGNFGTGGAIAATTDTEANSLMSYVKRLMSVKLPNAVSGRIPVDGSGVTQPVSAASLPLPSGAATEATLAGVKTAVEILDNAVSGSEMQVDIVSAPTITVNGTVTANLAPQASGPIIQIDSAIPSDPKYATIVGGFDTSAGESRALRLGSNGEMIVQDPALIAKSGGSVSDSVQNIQVIGGRTGGGGGSSSYAPASIDGNGGLQVGVKWIDTNSGNQTRDPSQQTPFPVQIISATSLPLPSGAATSASQATANTSLSNIDTDLGSPSESPAGSDTDTSGINGLLKRLLQRITTLIYPPFSSGSFDNSGTTSSAIDCAGYDYLVQHVSGGGGGYTRPVQWSNDGTNWTSSSPAVGTYFYYSSNSGWGTLQGNMGTSSGLFVFPVLGRYWRITTGGSGGGSWTHRWYLHKGPFPGILEDSIGSKISSAASSDTEDTGLVGLFKRLLQRITTLVPANLTVTSTRLLVDGSGVTQPVSGTITANAGSGTFAVSASSLPLPSGAATSANQSTSNASLASIDGKLPSALSGDRLKVDGSGVTQPVSGTVTANAGTGSFTVAQATHANLKAQAQILDSSGNQISYIQAGTAGSPSANVLSVQGVASGTAIPVSYSSGTFPVSASSLPLPSGASTSANQATTNSNIGSITESAATTDTSTSGLNGLFKRLLQRITTLIPANLTVTSTRLLVDGSGVTQPTTSRGATGMAIVATFTSTTSEEIRASEANRKLLTIFNEGAGNLYVLYGNGTASTTNYSVRVNAGDYLEIEKYTGEVRAIFATAGTARVTEIV